MAQHHTADGSDGSNDVQRIARDELRSFCERIERLQEDISTLRDDIKDVKGEAKGRGYDVSMINEMLKLRAMDSGEREEREAVRQTYGEALGLFG